MKNPLKCQWSNKDRRSAVRVGQAIYVFCSKKKTNVRVPNSSSCELCELYKQTKKEKP